MKTHAMGEFSRGRVQSQQHPRLSVTDITNNRKSRTFVCRLGDRRFLTFMVHRVDRPLDKLDIEHWSRVIF